MRHLVEKWTKKSVVPGVPQWLIPIVVLSLLAYLLRSIHYRQSNFSVFLFDYEYEFIRRGFLGAIVNLSPIELEEYYVFKAFYGMVSVALYFSVLALFSKSLNCERHESTSSNVLLCSFILVSPIFLKNSYWDFGRVDQLGFLCLVLFALAPPVAQRILVILLPPLLILCHEGQIILTVAPMIAIFLVSSLHENRVLQMRALIPLTISILVSLGLTVYFLLNAVPQVDPEVLHQYFESKSPYNTGERSWLLYDDFKTNVEIGMGQGREGRQLATSPLYLLVFILHLPVSAILYRAYQDTSKLSQRLACGVILLTVLAQCVIFFISIDYSRHIANIFFSFVVMLYFLINRFELGEMVAAHATRFRIILIALLFISLPIHRFGIISP